MITSKSLHGYVDFLSSNVSCHEYQEEHNRTITSRAYYSAFYGCREIIKKYSIELKKVKDAGEHVRTFVSMSECGDVVKDKNISKRIAWIAQEMFRLKRYRENADYDISILFRQNDVLFVRATANKILKEIDLLLN